MKNRTEEELKQIALDLHHGKIFTDKHLRSVEDLTMVFMILGLMSPEQLKKLKDDPPGMIFQYLSKAAPRSVNGMPTFFSCEMLSPDDAKKVIDMYNRLRESEKAVLDGKSG